MTEDLSLILKNFKWLYLSNWLSDLLSCLVLGHAIWTRGELNVPNFSWKVVINI